jgi:hypothetical protein
LTSTSQRKRYGAAEIHRDDVGPGYAQHRERAIEIVGLRADPVIRLERPVRLAPPEQVRRERRDATERQGRRDVAPEKSRSAEPVQEHHGPVSESVSLDVNRARSDRNPHACNLSSCAVYR